MKADSDEYDDKKASYANIAMSVGVCCCFVIILGLITLRDVTVSKWPSTQAKVESTTVQVLSSKGMVSQLPFTYVVAGNEFCQTVTEKTVLQNKSYDAVNRTLKISYDPSSPGQAVPFAPPNLLVDYILVALSVLALPCCFFASPKRSGVQSLREKIRADTKKNARYDYVQFEKMKPANFTVEQLNEDLTDTHQTENSRVDR